METILGSLRGIFGLICLLVMPISLVLLIVGVRAKHARMALASGGALIVSTLAVGVPFFHWRSNPNPIRTGVSVTPAEVTFLKLPVTASDVSYWDNNYCWMAEFTLPERDFLAVFPRFQFASITERESVNVIIYGDPNRPAYQQWNGPVRRVASGLIYETRQGNGGGFRIVYDRDASRGYFRYVAR